jgi:hypothetical protein
VDLVMRWAVVIHGSENKNTAYIGPFETAEEADTWMLRRGALLPEGCPPAKKVPMFDPATVTINGQKVE